METSRDIPPTACVIVAAGASTRMGAKAAGLSKPFLELNGRTLLEHACAAFDRSRGVREIVVVTRSQDIERVEALRRSSPALLKVTAVVAGGAERADSVRLGAAAISEGCELVCVHDAARPLIDTTTIERALAVTAEEGAALVAVRVVDTIKRTADGPGDRSEETLDRSRLFAAQTPQCFRRALLFELLERAQRDGFRPTDDAALHERYVGPIPIVEGEPTNLKITTPNDLALAQAILEGTASMTVTPRVGIGFDSHRLEPGRRCCLGGIEIDHPSGPVGHSDGDCVLHALTDAMLGAAGLDDLGTLFPDTDERWRGADSAKLLGAALERVRTAGWSPSSVDLVVMTDGPRIAPHRAAIRARIAQLLGLEADAVNVKGKSLEGLPSTESVATHAVCVVVRDASRSD